MIKKIVVVLMVCVVSMIEGVQVVLIDLIDNLTTQETEEVHQDLETGRSEIDELQNEEVIYNGDAEDEEQDLSEGRTEKTHIELLVDELKEAYNRFGSDISFVFTYIDKDALVDLVYWNNSRDFATYRKYVCIADEDNQVLNIWEDYAFEDDRRFRFVYNEGLFYSEGRHSTEKYIAVNEGDFDFLTSAWQRYENGVMTYYDASYKGEGVNPEEYQVIKKNLEKNDFCEISYYDFYQLNDDVLSTLVDNWSSYLYLGL